MVKSKCKMVSYICMALFFASASLVAAPRSRPVPLEDDLRRGVAVLREDTPLYSKPSESSETSDRESLVVGARYFVLGLSLDGQWAQLLTRQNNQGWVLVNKVNRLPESDPDLHGDFVKLVDRHYWSTNRFAINLGLYPPHDVVGEFVLSILPRGIGGLKGESLDLVAGATLVKKASQVGAHVAYRALLQWPFRMGSQGDFSVGPRLGYESREIYDPISVVSVRRAHHALLGALIRFMPNSAVGFVLVPEFLINVTPPNKSRFQAMAGITIMF